MQVLAKNRNLKNKSNFLLFEKKIRKTRKELQENEREGRNYTNVVRTHIPELRKKVFRKQRKTVSIRFRIIY